MHCISRPKTSRLTLFRDFCCLNSELGRNAGFYNTKQVALCTLRRVKKMAILKEQYKPVFLVLTFGFLQFT